MKYFRVVFLIVLLVIVAIAFSLSHWNEDMAPEAQRPPIEGVYEGSELPVNFPADFPIYPDSQVIDAYAVDGSATGMSVLFSSQEDEQKVIQFFLEELPKADWEISIGIETGIVSFEKDGVEGFVAIAKGEEGNVLISVTIGGGVVIPTM